MNKKIRTVVYDEELRIEAYRFEGIVQPFPNHFHAYLCDRLYGVQAADALVQASEVHAAAGLFRPESFHELLQPLHRPDARCVPRDFSAPRGLTASPPASTDEKENEKWICKTKSASW